MYDYLRNILPRVKQFSKDLDVKELFNDKHWVLVDDDGKRATYVFERDGGLVVSLSGHPKDGSWRYVSAAKSLYLKVDGQEPAFLNFNFFNDALFILKKDDDAETPWVLINKNVLPDLNVKNYLNSLLPEEERPDLDVKLELENGMILSVLGVKSLRSYYTEFKVSSIDNNIVSDGVYALKSEPKAIEIKGAIIKWYFEKVSYLTKDGQLNIYSKYTSFPAIGDYVFFNSNSNITDEFELQKNRHDIKIIVVKNGRIEKIILEPDWVIRIIGLVVGLTILAVIIIITFK